MSYTIDVYRGDASADAELHRLRLLRLDVPAARRRADHPLLGDRRPAARTARTPSTKFARGVAFFSLGLAKKVLLANPCGKIADLAFDAGVARRRSTPGTASIGLRVPDLLRLQRLLRHGDRPRPDARASCSRRTSTRPTARSRSPSSGAAGTSRCRPGCATTSTCRSAATARGRARTYVNLFIVMLLGGLWHGAAWNFVIWGALHGALLAFERLRGQGGALRRLAGAAARRVTFVLVLVAWVFFRAPDLPHAAALSRRHVRRSATPQRRRRPARRASSTSRTTSARFCWRR